MRSLENETLEQQVHARRIDLGDVQAETDRRIGRRTPPLAENIAAARERDDILHRQEIVFVVECADEFEFPADELLNIVWRAVRPTFPRARPGKLLQIFERR